MGCNWGRSVHIKTRPIDETMDHPDKIEEHNESKYKNSSKSTFAKKAEGKYIPGKENSEVNDIKLQNKNNGKYLKDLIWIHITLLKILLTLFVIRCWLLSSC